MSGLASARSHIFRHEQAQIQALKRILEYKVTPYADRRLQPVDEPLNAGNSLMHTALQLVCEATASSEAVVLGRRSMSSASDRLVKVWKTLDGSESLLKTGALLEVTQTFLDDVAKMSQDDHPGENPPIKASCRCYRDVRDCFVQPGSLADVRYATFYPVDIALSHDPTAPIHKQWILTWTDSDNKDYEESHNTYAELSGKIFAGIYRLIYAGRYGDLMRHYVEAITAYNPDAIAEAGEAFLNWCHDWGAPVPYVVLRDCVDAKVVRAKRELSLHDIGKIGDKLHLESLLLEKGCTPKDVEDLMAYAQDVADAYKEAGKS